MSPLEGALLNNNLRAVSTMHLQHSTTVRTTSALYHLGLPVDVDHEFTIMYNVLYQKVGLLLDNYVEYAKLTLHDGDKQMVSTVWQRQGRVEQRRVEQRKNRWLAGRLAGPRPRTVTCNINLGDRFVLQTLSDATMNQLRLMVCPWDRYRHRECSQNARLCCCSSSAPLLSNSSRQCTANAVPMQVPFNGVGILIGPSVTIHTRAG